MIAAAFRFDSRWIGSRLVTDRVDCYLLIAAGEWSTGFEEKPASIAGNNAMVTERRHRICKVVPSPFADSLCSPACKRLGFIAYISLVKRADRFV